MIVGEASRKHGTSPPNRSNEEPHLRANPFEKAGGYRIRSIQGATGIPDEISTPARTAGKQGESEWSKTVLRVRVAAHVGRPSSVQRVLMTKQKTPCNMEEEVGKEWSH